MFGGVLGKLLTGAADDLASTATRKMGSSASKSVLSDLVPAAAAQPARSVARTAPAQPFAARFGRSTGNPDIDSRIAEIATMSPDDYLQKAFQATDGRLGGSYDSWLASNAVDPATTKSYAEAMKRGDEFPLAYIDNALGSQDGRNRALAVKMAGGKEMPVGMIPEMDDQQALKYYTDQLDKAGSDYSRFTYQKKIDTINERIKAAQPIIPDYAMSHRPTRTGATADNITQDVSDMGLPSDFYDHPEYYANMREPSYVESMNALKKIRNNPDAEITIYRASPKGELNEGDWITLSPAYAKGESLAEGTPVHSFKVKAREIQFAGDDINEFGYWPNGGVDE